jgi:GAF domain-containing protein
MGAVLGERNAGFINLLRDKDHPEFESEDEPFLKVLARLLASALRVALLRDKQTGLLVFANLVTEAETPTQVCEYLAETLHREIHDHQNTESKVSVRLLDFGTGELKREIHLGLPVKDTPIFLTTQKSIYTKVVRENTHLPTEEFCDSEHLFDHSDYLESVIDTVCINSELCVPLSIGKSSMGAVNLEHTKKNFYLAHDTDFVKAAAATLAANAIERIRKARLLEGMTDFALRFAYESNQRLEQRLHDLLYEFCGYSVLVDWNSSESGKPWQIHDLDFRLTVK